MTELTGSLERLPTEYTSIVSILKDFVKKGSNRPPHATFQLGQEHQQRYKFAGKRIDYPTKVLDISCGDGYGSELLKKAGAKHVVGIDIDTIASKNAQSKHGKYVEFVTGDAQKIPIKDKSFATITSFETYEHVQDPELFLSEVTRVLDEDGTLIISTPNRNISNPNTARQDTPNNPFHKFEVSPAEFLEDLKKHFGDVELFGQDPNSDTSDHQRSLPNKFKRLKKIFTLDASRVVPVKVDQNPAFMVAICKNPRKN